MRSPAGSCAVAATASARTADVSTTSGTTRVRPRPRPTLHLRADTQSQTTSMGAELINSEPDSQHIILVSIRPARFVGTHLVATIDLADKLPDLAVWRPGSGLPLRTTSVPLEKASRRAQRTAAMSAGVSTRAQPARGARAAGAPGALIRLRDADTDDYRGDEEDDAVVEPRRNRLRPLLARQAGKSAFCLKSP